MDHHLLVLLSWLESLFPLKDASSCLYRSINRSRHLLFLSLARDLSASLVYSTFFSRFVSSLALSLLNLQIIESLCQRIGGKIRMLTHTHTLTHTSITTWTLSRLLFFRLRSLFLISAIDYLSLASTGRRDFPSPSLSQIENDSDSTWHFRWLNRATHLYLSDVRFS